MGKIILVEDEIDMANQIRDWLVRDGHIVEVEYNGLDGLERIVGNQYDLILLDRMLPQMDGLEICRQYRQSGGKIPIILLTARDTPNEIADGLNAGADDYLGKPFHFVELSARVRAAIRRGGTLVSQQYKVGELILDPEARKVTNAGTVIHLEPKEFNLLEFFMRNPNRTFSALTLIERVWDSDTNVASDTVRTYIKALRRKINASVITTVHGFGYRLDLE